MSHLPANLAVLIYPNTYPKVGLEYPQIRRAVKRLKVMVMGE